MAKKIGQILFHGTESLTDFITGTAFANYMPLNQLGIQGPPGTKFYLNGSVYPIIIGASGIFDLDIKNGARVTQLQFDQDDLRRVTENNFLIIDMLYGEED